MQEGALNPAAAAQGLKASMTAQVAWTPLWAAPEVFRQERATVKADIWSYGIIIYELVRAPLRLTLPQPAKPLRLLSAQLCGRVQPQPAA